MNRFALLPALLLAAAVAVAGFTGLDSSPPPPSGDTDPVAWSLDPAHSEVRFGITHLAISRVTGKFHDYDASVTMDPDDLSSLSVDATVRIESIDTGNEKRDDHLRSADFFDASNHPEMRFVSNEITNVNGNTFQMKGDLMIRGTTKPVVFETELLGTAVDNEGRQRAGFTAATTINRKDFGLTWNRVTEAGGLVVGEDVDITLDIQTIRGDA